MQERERMAGRPAMDHLEQLHDASVSIWLDTLSRQLVVSRATAALIAAYAVAGATSNPTSFAKAITPSDRHLRPLPLPRSPGR